MKKFTFTVQEDLFPHLFEGDIVAENEAAALEDISEWYAMELGTTTDDLTVTITAVS